MNPQKDNMFTKQAPELYMEEEDNQWISGSPTRISKIGSLNVSTATSTNTWQRNAEQRKKNEKHEHVLNATRRDILPRTAEESR